MLHLLHFFFIADSDTLLTFSISVIFTDWDHGYPNNSDVDKHCLLVIFSYIKENKIKELQKNWWKRFCVKLLFNFLKFTSLS